ncbi:hypothetical protein GC173_00920 [bacterium]|nr:hypothetical protein [bacterium]
MRHFVTKLTVGAALLVASTALQAGTPLGVAKPTGALELTRDGSALQLAESQSLLLMAGDRLATTDSPARATLLDGTSLLQSPNSALSLGEDGTVRIEKGMVVASTAKASAVESEGLRILPTQESAVASFSVDRKSDELVEVTSLSGSPVAVRSIETGEQLGVIMPGDVLSFTRTELGTWRVQAPMVLQETEGVEDGTNSETTEDKAAAAPLATTTTAGGGGVGGTTAAIGGGIIVVGGGTAVAASPRLRERLGITNEDDNNDNNDSSPTVPPPADPTDVK